MKNFLSRIVDLATGGESGTTGNLSWRISGETLTIKGTGAMPDYKSSTSPWRPYRKSITAVVIDNGVSCIGNRAFYKFHGLTSVTIPDSVITIGNSAFSGCRDLISVTIPHSVTTINYGAFYDCGLTSVTIPHSVIAIGDGAFFRCNDLTSVTFDSIEDIAVPNPLTTIPSRAFAGCRSLTSITIPHSVTTIRSGAFSGCRSLTSITIPDEVTTIRSGAFSGCRSLTSITLPNSLTFIGNYVFSDCHRLTEIINHATTPLTIDDKVFNNMDKTTCTLRVPADSVDAYQTAEVWKEFRVTGLMSAPVNPKNI